MRCVGDGDAAVHRHRQLAGDGEPEPRARAVFGVEGAEHVGALGRRDPRAGVVDGDPHAPGLGQRADHHRALVGGPAHCVADKVADDLQDAIAVADDHRQRAGLQGDLDVAFARLRALPRHDLVQQDVEIDLIGLEAEALGLQPGEVEQVADEAVEAHRLGGDRGVGELLLGLVLEDAVDERVDLAADGGQGRAQLVRDAHQELPLRVARLREPHGHVREGAVDHPDLVGAPGIERHDLIAAGDGPGRQGEAAQRAHEAQAEHQGEDDRHREADREGRHQRNAQRPGRRDDLGRRAGDDQQSEGHATLGVAGARREDAARHDDVVAELRVEPVLRHLDRPAAFDGLEQRRVTPHECGVVGGILLRRGQCAPDLQGAEPERARLNQLARVDRHVVQARVDRLLHVGALDHLVGIAEHGGVDERPVDARQARGNALLVADLLRPPLALLLVGVGADRAQG